MTDLQIRAQEALERERHNREAEALEARARNAASLQAIASRKQATAAEKRQKWDERRDKLQLLGQFQRATMGTAQSAFKQFSPGGLIRRFGEDLSPISGVLKNVSGAAKDIFGQGGAYQGFATMAG